ncbi:hypothetical protein JOB18_001163 [Solea senegalensis]|uniref:Uncharacterized protein n=1 Tax=Solea senegalensis TaxID=28829 RepID=A0AAV6QFA1_SOLSE|nr:hypothetical protein JOB18_001163 [Solea senegalensis]
MAARYATRTVNVIERSARVGDGRSRDWTFSPHDIQSLAFSDKNHRMSSKIGQKSHSLVCRPKLVKKVIV